MIETIAMWIVRVIVLLVILGFIWVVHDVAKNLINGGYEKRLVQWSKGDLEAGQLNKLIDKVKEKVPYIGKWKEITHDALRDRTEQLKRIWTLSAITLAGIAPLLYLIARLTGNPFTMDCLSIFIDRAGQVWNGLFGANAWSIYLPFNVPLALNGTCGLLLAMWIGSILWPGLTILNEKLGGFAGFCTIFDSEKREVGRILAGPGDLTCTRYIDDDTIAIVCTPWKPFHYNRFVLFCEFLYALIPTLRNEGDFPVDKLLIIAKKDSVKPDENYSIEDVYLQDELHFTERYLHRGPMVVGILTCGFTNENC
jgi:hypothetical protein